MYGDGRLGPEARIDHRLTAFAIGGRCGAYSLFARRWGSHTELAPHAGLVKDLPGFDDPSALDAKDDDLVDEARATGGRDSCNVLAVRATIGHVRDHDITFGDQRAQVKMPVRKRRCPLLCNGACAGWVAVELA